MFDWAAAVELLDAPIAQELNALIGVVKQSEQTVGDPGHGLDIGGAGAFIARSIKMTDMPQLVAAFHSLVGLAAVAVAAAAFYAPESFGETPNATLEVAP